MKHLVLSIGVIALLSATVGCANGPIRNLFRGNSCDTCQPPVQPTFGPQAGCQGGTCSPGNLQGSSYLNDSFIQGDPYINGSNYGGATINPPVFDNNGSTIVPPGSGYLPPGPENGG